MILELIQNRSFTLTTSDSKRNRLRRKRNGVLQGSVLTSLLYIVYICDLISATFRKYAYANDLALLHSSRDRKGLEEILSLDMATLSAYLEIWRMKLSHAKTVAAASYLHDREGKRELKIYVNGKLFLFCPVRAYLGANLIDHFLIPPPF